MGSLGPLEIIAIVLVILVLFGYKKLPAASRSLGQSLRIFKGEMKGMKSDDGATRDAAQVPSVRAELPARPATGDDLTSQLHEEARAAELRAAELRARPDQHGSVDGSR
jgi:sec-independent protein translocase protein TatA